MDYGAYTMISTLPQFADEVLCVGYKKVAIALFVCCHLFQVTYLLLWTSEFVRIKRALRRQDDHDSRVRVGRRQGAEVRMAQHRVDSTRLHDRW